MKEEIKKEELMRNLGAFARFREAISFSHKSFLHDYPEARAMLLNRAKEKLVVDGITCWPVEEFLLQLKPNEWPG